MAPIPVVGSKKLHISQLSPEVRRILHHRAAEANRREAAPILRADRQAFGSANRAYRSEVQSVKGATNMVQNSLAQALRGLQGSGLSGGYLKQVQRELTSRQADAASSIPALLGDAAKERTSNILDARQQLISDRAQMQAGTAQDFNQLLKEARSSASTALKEQQGNSPADSLKSDPRALKTALMAATAGYQELLQNSGQKTKEGTVIHPPQTDQEWRTFALQVAKTEGADPIDAANAVKILRERIERQLQKGNARPLGIVFNAG